eukprot:TRINITY_DN4331_c0_g1_i1.p1 TRINITY_DN4331_c0_g1~~TRINITY_DN4331_c0_g1_i1.p1  ORF type:complete len:148 (+),score=50.27 TRINITY_DN4331_c0_g1_i1:108-551(+)
MAQYSPALLWEVTKKDSSFLRKPITANLPWMSAHPQNLTGVNSFKFSGLTAGKIVGLNAVKKGSKEKIVLSLGAKRASRKQRPGACKGETGLPKSTKKAMPVLEKALGESFYRRDLLDLAKAKYVKIKESFKKKARKVSSRRAPKTA